MFPLAFVGLSGFSSPRSADSIRNTVSRQGRCGLRPSAFVGSVLVLGSVFAPGLASLCDSADTCKVDTMTTPVAKLTDLQPMKTINGDTLDPSTFKGKLMFAVNVASACGYTASGYETMRSLGEKYPDDLVVVAVPCNQFGMQENGTPGEIAAFGQERYAKLVMTERSNVNGDNVHPIMALGKSKFPGDVRVSRTFNCIFV